MNMPKLNHLYNAEKILSTDKHIHQKWGNKVLKVCPSIQ